MSRNTGRAWDELWSAEEAAAFLDVTPGWVYQLVRANRIPYVRRRRRVRFDPDQIRAWDRIQELKVEEVQA